MILVGKAMFYNVIMLNKYSINKYGCLLWQILQSWYKKWLAINAQHDDSESVRGIIFFINNAILVQKHFFWKKRSNEKVLETFKTNIITFILGKTHEFECFKWSVVNSE